MTDREQTLSEPLIFLEGKNSEFLAFQRRRLWKTEARQGLNIVDPCHLQAIRSCYTIENVEEAMLAPGDHILNWCRHHRGFETSYTIVGRAKSRHLTRKWGDKRHLFTSLARSLRCEPRGARCAAQSNIPPSPATGGRIWGPGVKSWQMNIINIMHRWQTDGR